MRRLVPLLMAGLMGLVALGAPAGASAAEGACSNEALRAGLGSSALPECRAYEMVSPVEKNGADVSPGTSRTRVAADGNAVQYVALGASAGSQGTDAIGAEYIAERGADGWATHAITPPQPPPAFPVWSSMYVGDFSANLDKGVFYALSPVTQEDPNVANVPNLYLRDDLLSAGAGHYRLLSGCAACSSLLAPPAFELVRPDVVTLAGASDDLSHVLFESPNNLLPGAEGSEPKLYESVNGVLRLAGILPDSACGTPPCVASASVGGRGASRRQPWLQELTAEAISHDGSRILFTAAPFTRPVELGFANEGSPFAGSLYLREGGTRTVQLNASERSPAEAPQPAYFVAASADVAKVFFVTQERLTEDDTDGNLNMYMYDVNAPAGHHLTRISDAEEVIGASSGGEYVYFYYGHGELVPGQATVLGERQLYVWHNGTVRYIGSGSGEGLSGGDVPWRAGSVAPAHRTSQVRVTPDGKHMVFVTANPQMAEALGYDSNDSRCPSWRQNNCSEVYLYSYDTDSVVCVSCDSSGAAPAGDAAIVSLNERDTTRFTATQHLPHALSDDGNVFFDSPDPLVPQDTNGKYDVYEYVVSSGALKLISSGQSGGDSRFAEATANGHDVFFVTSQQLVGADIDGNADLYDARVDGGISAQLDASVASECSEDLCQGSPTGGPALSSPSSLTFAGAGNVLSVAQVPVAKPKSKAKPKKKAKAKKRANAKRRVKRRGKAGKARTSHKSHLVGR